MGIRLRREVLPSGAGPGPESRFEGPEVRIGRGEEAHLRLEDRVGSPVSRRHARIVWLPPSGPASTTEAHTLEVPGLRVALPDAERPGWWLEDLESRNGTFLNEVRILGPQPLRSGDRVRFGPGGPVFMVFMDGEAPTPALHGAGLKGRGRGGGMAALLLVAGGLALVAVGIALVGPRGGNGPGGGWPEGPRGDADWGGVGTGARGPAEGVAPETADEARGGLGPGGAQSRGEWGAEPGTGAGGAAAPPGGSRIEGATDPAGSARGESWEGQGPGAATGTRDGVEAGPGTGPGAGPGGTSGIVSGPEAGPEASLSSAQEALARQARRAVALVWVEDAEGGVATGTAFATRPDGLLVTVRHLVLPDPDTSPPRRIGVQFADSEQVWEARLEGVSTEVDLAVLRVVTLPWDQIPRIDALNLRPDTLGPGAPVVVVGFAEGGTGEAEGRGLARPVSGAGELEAVTPTQLRIRGPGASGASGSPVLDAAGAVVGVVYGGVEGDLHAAGSHRLVAVNAVQVARFLARFPVQRGQEPP
jgi:pSer/pThr/pTyr-binding forkhead associated (FHA) protein